MKPKHTDDEVVAQVADICAANPKALRSEILKLGNFSHSRIAKLLKDGKLPMYPKALTATETARSSRAKSAWGNFQIKKVLK